MNLSNIITRIKMKLGLINIVTPIENLDSVITEIITEITVPVFSIYAPYKETMHLDVYDLEMIEKRDNSEKFLLPDFLTKKLYYVFNIGYDCNMVSGLGYWSGGLQVTGVNLLQELALGNANMNVSNMVIPKMTFRFTPPRTIEIFNAYTSSSMIFDFGFEHDKTLASIPESCRESFMELALLDVKENLYPTMKNFSEIQTAIGTINLKIDDWANAEADRKELINRWDDTYHLDWQPFWWA